MIRTLIKPIIKKYRKQYFSMIIVSLLGIGLLSSLSSAYMSLDLSLKAYLDEYDYADGEVFTAAPVEEDVSEELYKISGVKEVNARIAADFSARLANGRIVSLRGFTYGLRDFSKFYIWESNKSSEYPNICVEKKFADKNSLKAGDLIEAEIGDEFMKVCIGSVVSSPECLRVIKDEFLPSENADFGYVFIPDEIIHLTNYAGYANQFRFLFSEGADSDEVIRSAVDIIRKAGGSTVYGYTKANSPLLTLVSEALTEVHTLSLIAPALIFGCTVVIVWLFISQIIRMTRNDIGILRALGFRDGKIRLLFCLITLIVSLISCLIGLIIGAGVYSVVTIGYSKYFALPHLILTPDLPKVIISILLTIVTGQIATIAGTHKITRIHPTEAMSRELPSFSQLPDGVNRMLKRASVIGKFGVVMLFRNMKSFIFSFICLAVAIMPIFGALSLECSHYNIVGELSNKRIHYDAEMIFSKNPDESTVNELLDTGLITDCEIAGFVTGELTFGGRSKTIMLNEIDPKTDEITIKGLNGRKSVIPDHGIVLDKYTADNLGIKTGDTVTVADAEYEVTGFSRQNLNLTQYANIDQPGNASPTRYVLWCRMDKKNQNALLEYALTLDDYMYTIFPDVLFSGIQEEFVFFSLSIYIILAFSVVLGITVVYNTTMTNLFSQRRELAVLRALGFQISKLRRVWFIQSGLLFILSLIIGIPLGMVFSRYLQYIMTSEHFVYTSNFEWWQYAVTVVLSAVTVIISHCGSFNSLRKWNISEMAKEKE